MVNKVRVAVLWVLFGCYYGPWGVVDSRQVYADIGSVSASASALGLKWWRKQLPVMLLDWLKGDRLTS